MVEITVEILEGTDRAIQVTDGDVTTWIPRSQISETRHLKNGTYEIDIPKWLALKRGLINE